MAQKGIAFLVCLCTTLYLKNVYHFPGGYSQPAISSMCRPAIECPWLSALGTVQPACSRR